MDKYAELIENLGFAESATLLASACRVKDGTIIILRSALMTAKDTIKALHGDVAWDIYDQHSPEMKRINWALGETNE